MSRILKLLFPSPEQKLYSAINTGKLEEVNQALTKRPDVNTKEYFTFYPHPQYVKSGKYLFATRSAIKSHLAGSNTMDRGSIKYQTFFLTPVELAVKTGLSMESADGIVRALVAYGYPPHECDFANAAPPEPCTLLCAFCGKRKAIHDWQALCQCEDGARVCLRCGDFVSSREFLIYKYYSSPNNFNVSGRIEVCVECGKVVRHSSLAGVRLDKVRSFKQIEGKDCLMLDPATGKTYEIHAGVILARGEYDTDYNRTIDSASCPKCGKSFSCDWDLSRCKGDPVERPRQIRKEREHLAFEDELRLLVVEGKVALAMKRYREKNPRASMTETKEYVMSLK